MSSELKKRGKVAKSAEKKLPETINDKEQPSTSAAARASEKKEREEQKISAGDPPPKFGPLPPVSKQRLWSRTALILGLMTIVWYNSWQKNEVSLAKFDEEIKARSFKTKCSPALEQAVAPFADTGCIPKHCGRIVTDDLISTEEMLSLLDLAERGLKEANTNGGAIILDLHTGFLSFEDKYIDVYKLNQTKKIFRPEDRLVYQAVKSKLRRLVSTYFGVDYWSLHLTFPTFISQFSKKPAKARKDQYWHITVHQEHFDHFHYSTVLFLSDFGKDFQGGRLIFTDGDNTNRTVDPKKGRAVGFTSGEENKHFIEKVSDGSRFSLTLGFTCDSKKSIKDPKL